MKILVTDRRKRLAHDMHDTLMRQLIKSKWLWDNGEVELFCLMWKLQNDASLVAA